MAQDSQSRIRLNSSVSFSPQTDVWHSFYLYPTDSLDAFLATRFQACSNEIGSVLFPSAEKGFRFFLVRYQDRTWGPHVRVRYAGPRVQQSLDESRKIIVSPKFQQRHGLRHLRDVRYRPEVARYGGHRRLSVSEDFFCRSTEWFLANHQTILKSHEQRVAASAISADLLLRAVRPTLEGRRLVVRHMFDGIIEFGTRRDSADAITSRIMNLYEDDSAGWARCFLFAEQISGAIHSDVSDPFLAWRSQCCTHVQRLTASSRRPAAQGQVLTRILMSWIHMHSNRLGLSLVEEAIQAHAFLRAAR